MALVPFPKKAAPSGAEEPESDWDDHEPESEQGGKMSFLDHLDELRKRIIYALVSVVLGFIVAVFFLDPIFNFVMAPMQAALEPGQRLIFTDPTEALMLKLKMAVIAGLLLASPAVMSQVWLFIAPGLYSNEKKLAIPFVALSSVCFVGGAAFAHYVVFPLTWKFFASFASDLITFMPRIEPAFGLYMKLLLVFGAVFQMPTLVLFLAKLGIVSARFLIRHMKYAILIMFVVRAVLSPGTDPVGQVLLAGPMFVLYVISIGLAWLFGKKKKPLEEV